MSLTTLTDEVEKQRRRSSKNKSHLRLERDALIAGDFHCGLPFDTILNTYAVSRATAYRAIKRFNEACDEQSEHEAAHVSDAGVFFRERPTRIIKTGASVLPCQSTFTQANSTKEVSFEPQFHNRLVSKEESLQQSSLTPPFLILNTALSQGINRGFLRGGEKSFFSSMKLSFASQPRLMSILSPFTSLSAAPVPVSRPSRITTTPPPKRMMRRVDSTPHERPVEQPQVDRQARAPTQRLNAPAPSTAEQIARIETMKKKMFLEFTARRNKEDADYLAAKEREAKAKEARLTLIAPPIRPLKRTTQRTLAPIARPTLGRDSPSPKSAPIEVQLAALMRKIEVVRKTVCAEMRADKDSPIDASDDRDRRRLLYLRCLSARQESKKDTASYQELLSLFGDVPPLEVRGAIKEAQQLLFNRLSHEMSELNRVLSLFNLLNTINFPTNQISSSLLTLVERISVMSETIDMGEQELAANEASGVALDVFFSAIDKNLLTQDDYDTADSAAKATTIALTHQLEMYTLLAYEGDVLLLELTQSYSRRPARVGVTKVTRSVLAYAQHYDQFALAPCIEVFDTLVGLISESNEMIRKALDKHRKITASDKTSQSRAMVLFNTPTDLPAMRVLIS